MTGEMIITVLIVIVFLIVNRIAGFGQNRPLIGVIIFGLIGLLTGGTLYQYTLSGMLSFSLLFAVGATLWWFSVGRLRMKSFNGVPEWVPLVPILKGLFEDNRNNISKVILSEISEQGDNVNINNKSFQSEEFQKNLITWQVVSTASFIGYMRYIRDDESDVFWIALCNAIFEEDKNTNKDYFSEYKPYIEKINTIMFGEATKKDFVEAIAKVLTLELSKDQSSTNIIKPIIKSAVKAEMNFRNLKVAQFFGDTETSYKLESLY